MENIANHEQEIVQYGLERMDEIAGVTVVGPRKGRGGVLAFTLKGIHPHDIAQLLDDEGIAVRAGHHCAQPLHIKLGLPATTRASFYLYNTKEEVDKLVIGLEKVKATFA
jgi:cysteine desulfurase/selenocysteine lyase